MRALRDADLGWLWETAAGRDFQRNVAEERKLFEYFGQFEEGCRDVLLEPLSDALTLEIVGWLRGHELLRTARDVDQAELCAQERAIVRSTIREETAELLEGMDSIRLAVDEELCDLDMDEDG